MDHSNQTKLDLLRQTPLFANVDDEFLAKLSASASLITRPKNIIVIYEGDLSDSFHIIRSGKVKVYVSDADGNEVILNYLNAGEYFGELSFLDQKPRSASIITVEPCQILSLPRPVFMQHLQMHPEAMLTLLQVLTNKLRQQTLATKSLALEDVYGRLIRLWFEQGELTDGSLVVHDINHQQLADHVFASRPMVTRIINKLEKNGHINYDRTSNCIAITKTLPKKWR